MINENKFKKLPFKTQLKKIAAELELMRNSALNDKIYISKEFSQYISFLKEYDYFKPYRGKIDQILTVSDNILFLEYVHFLYHQFMMDIGYPVSEKQFVQKKTDGCNIVRKNNLVLILENLQSAFNVGSIIRLADGFGVRKIYAVGMTPDQLHSQVIKTAKNSHNFVDFEKNDNLAYIINSLKKEGYSISALETVDNANSLYNFNFDPLSAIIVGNEEIGITKETMKLCDNIIKIQLTGFKNSINVSTAAAIAIYEYNKQNQF